MTARTARMRKKKRRRLRVGCILGQSMDSGIAHPFSLMVKKVVRRDEVKVSGVLLIEAADNPRPVHKLCHQTQHPKQDHTTSSLPEHSQNPFQACPSTRRNRRSEEHTSELQSQSNLVCRLLLEKKNKNIKFQISSSSISLLSPPTHHASTVI